MTKALLLKSHLHVLMNKTIGKALQPIAELVERNRPMDKGFNAHSMALPRARQVSSPKKTLFHIFSSKTSLYIFLTFCLFPWIKILSQVQKWCQLSNPTYTISVLPIDKIIYNHDNNQLFISHVRTYSGMFTATIDEGRRAKNDFGGQLFLIG
jgi:hypothetical protein